MLFRLKDLLRRINIYSSVLLFPSRCLITLKLNMKSETLLVFKNAKSFNFKTSLDSAWEASITGYPGTAMFAGTCSEDAACGKCGKKNTAGGAVTCPLSSPKTGTDTTTTCTFCADNGNECCTTPTCANTDGSSTPFPLSSCPTGQSLKNDLSAVNCATAVCAASDCCYVPLCAVTDGKTTNTVGIDCQCGTSVCSSNMGMFCQTNTCHTSAFGSDALPDGDGRWQAPDV